MSKKIAVHVRGKLTRMPREKLGTDLLEALASVERANIETLKNKQQPQRRSPVVVQSSTIELSDEQLAAIDHLLAFKRPIQTMGGLAGTGKSYVVRALSEALPRFAVCAYTGKAVDVLRRRGISDASTIHSLAYRRVEEVDGRGNRTARYELKEALGVYGSEDPVDGLIVDEASMVGKELHADLMRFGKPIIFVGDHGQLEPIGDKDFNLMGKPDVTLETIHRNAGEIARFAEHLRKGGQPREWKGVGDKVRFSRSPSKEFGVVDQMICAFNSKRVQLNQSERARRGFPADEPVVGDRVICLHNSRDHDVFNGMQGAVTEIGEELCERRWLSVLTFRGDDGVERQVPFIPEQFNREQKMDWQDFDGRVPFDYSYAVSCHKSQGAEWQRVMVFDQPCRAWDMCRWRYTAASRAKQALIWV